MGMNMAKKIRVGILFGGKSAEHEVSLQSAKNVYDAIDKNKYEVTLIGIDKQGRWYLSSEKQFLLSVDNPKLIKFKNVKENLALMPGENKKQLMKIADSRTIDLIDVIFPVLHGTFGEDGTIQGLLKLANIPFVGAGVLGSAVGMDKDVMKRLLRDAGIPIARFLTFKKHEKSDINFSKVVDTLGLPCYVKPANLGSSVGIHRVTNKDEFDAAIEDAFLYDIKILIEQGIEGREIECSVLGNENPIASVPGEVITNKEKHLFYSYQAKYLDENGALLRIPADLSPIVTKQIQKMAVESFKAICCEGMARVDFFLKNDDQIYVNELNTIPGFTKISMYPKLWQASGISYTELIDRLIQLALERFEKENNLKTSVDL